MEIDNHADTTVLGRNCLPIQDYNRAVNVSGWDESQGSVECPTISGAVAYDHPVSGKTYILIYHQVIHCERLPHHLMCPMQSRIADVEINELPKFLAKNPDERTHAVVVDDPISNEPLIIPLEIKGVTSYFPTRKPTLREYEEDSIPKINMTSELPDWEPSTADFAEQESAMIDAGGQVISNDIIDRGRRFINAVSISTVDVNDNEIDSIDFTADNNFADALERRVVVSRVGVSKNKEGINVERLSNNWKISPEAAKRTLERTTQRGVRTVLNPTLSRRYSTNDRFLRYNRLQHDWYTDTMFAGIVSRRQNTCAQMYGSSFGWSRAHCMKRKGEAHETLSLMFKREGVPPRLIVDNSKEQTQGKFRKKCREADCHLKQTEPYSPWQQLAEGTIREVKKGAGRKMISSGCPKRFWDDALEFEAFIRSHTALDIYSLRGEVPETIMTGSTADISKYCEHGFYDFIMFRDENVQYPDDNPVLGRWLGPAIDVGSAMCAYILMANGEVVVRSTYRALNDGERNSEVHRQLRKDFDEAIKIRFGPEANPIDFPEIGLEETPTYAMYEDSTVTAANNNEEGMEGSPDDEPAVDEVIPTPELNDNYINASIMLPYGGSHARGTVLNRKRSADGNVVGRANANPMLDTREYHVRFDDGEVSEMTANLIAESMYASCDNEGNEYLLLDCIVDYRKNSKAISIEDQKTTSRGRKKMRKTTVGWELCVQWRDGSTSWQTVNDLKRSHPIETSEYAVAQGISHEPAFNWWVNATLKKREAIISLVKKRGAARYLKKNYKFGIQVPRNAQEARKLDAENGDTKWQDSEVKEMIDVRPAFDILEDGAKIPVGHQQIRCHMIYDVKMEDFRRKSRLVAGGHVTKPPATITYASVVSRETVRIALTVAALNDLQVKVGDIQNAYITAPCQEKIVTRLGPEFGADEGKLAVIVRAIYGLKSSGASFRNHLASLMRHLEFTPCKADPDLWMKAMVRPEDGFEYYAYILLYVDDCLVIHHDALSVLLQVDKYFKLKPIKNNGDPDIYLGAKLKKMKLANGVTCWANSAAKYVQESVSNVEKFLEELNDPRWKLPTRKNQDNAFPTNYAPELDTSPLLEPDLASWYNSIIGMAKWTVELGRVDIMTEVSMLSSQLAMPREGHLDAVLHLYAFLKQKYNARLAFDPTYPDIDESVFKDCNWKEFYGEVTEAIPPDTPEPRGKMIDLRAFVDSDHAGEEKTRRSRSGYFIFINLALIQWFSKLQPTIETSVFGAEFVAMKLVMEALRGIRYKLRMMGIPISGPSHIYGDNMSVIHNTQRPESTLKKKSNSIAYHAVRESVAMGESLTGHVSTNDNCADIATKVTCGGKRKYHVSNLLYDIYDDH